MKYANGQTASERVILDTIDNLIREPPILMAELTDVGETHRDNFSEIDKYILDLGYSLYEIGKHALKRCAHISNSKRRNFFLANEDSLPLREFHDGSGKPTFVMSAHSNILWIEFAKL